MHEHDKNNYNYKPTSCRIKSGKINIHTKVRRDQNINSTSPTTGGVTTVSLVSCSTTPERITTALGSIPIIISHYILVQVGNHIDNLPV